MENEIKLITSEKVKSLALLNLHNHRLTRTRIKNNADEPFMKIIQLAVWKDNF